MHRRFNTTGPCVPGEHYMLPPEKRCPEIMPLIEGRSFFVLHAARQTGKTTLLRTLTRALNAAGSHHALYVSLESVQGLDDPERGMPAIVQSFLGAASFSPAIAETLPGVHPDFSNITNVLRLTLTRVCQVTDRPLAVFFDEADCLGGQTLIMFLRQLREGYITRSDIPFVSSLALVGMRNIRDYKASVRPDSHTLGSASPFNIAKAALTLPTFSHAEVATLYAQHTAETGQVFPAAFTQRVFDLTQGQPWLVNAIAAETVEKLCGGDTSAAILPEMADEAAQRLILRRDTHLDSLLERLKEDRVRRVIQPVLLGSEGELSRLDDDFLYVRDLGLIREDKGTVRPANPIYGEVIARTLNYDSQQDLSRTVEHHWITANGRLDMNGLLRGFQAFWRENSEVWVERYAYKEAAPHLILQAFMQRVLNGGGHIAREFATGTRRVDLCVEYGAHRYPVELKLVRGEKTRAEGLEQLATYMETLGVGEGWLVLFDRDPDKPWDDKVFWQTETRDGRTLHVVGC